MTTKIFISYRSLDAARVDASLQRLKSLKSEDGSLRYDLWQDKRRILAAQDWWKSIIRAIIDCDIFVLMVSSESVRNPNCRAEINYAFKRNRPIIPLVLENEYEYQQDKGKYDINFWEQVPLELNNLRSQFLFCTSADFYPLFDEAVAKLLAERAAGQWQDHYLPEPPHPPDASTVADLYEQACDYASILAFDEAERLFDTVSEWLSSPLHQNAEEWLVILRRYRELLTYDRPSTQHTMRNLWQEYLSLFPKPFINGFFDPKDFKSRYQNGAATENKAST